MTALFSSRLGPDDSVEQLLLIRVSESSQSFLLDDATLHTWHKNYTNYSGIIFMRGRPYYSRNYSGIIGAGLLVAGTRNMYKDNIDFDKAFSRAYTRGLGNTVSREYDRSATLFPSEYGLALFTRSEKRKYM